ncbi:hypothetical protein L0669_17110 [Flavobacterium bizetiae]|uniref:hypothetical protein n=1 Tax=Flavobacterium bizetiae TaxID=2704140 RepID=UPI0021E84587|nr:hypothetical protein [Flavobacterium bizetiae]UTN03046.1 hypothetical protein L0669_17110 [Flavobacterium bizetiae]
MRKILLTTLLLSQVNFAQSFFPTDGGNVGIGTLNPTSNLEIRETISTSIPSGLTAPTKSILKFSRNGTNGYSYNENAEFRLGHGGNSFYGSKLDLYINGNSNTNSIPDQHVMTWNYDGSVGIGTDTPIAKLHVNNGNNSYGAILANSSELPFSLYTKTINTDIINGESFRIGLKYANDENNGFISFYRGAGTIGGFLGFATYGIERLRISNNGNVGIGITNPQNKLDVNGTIHSKEVKVDMIGWSDFVFKKEFNLPTLAEVENHINEKGHLENIPTEEEVLKNGINLGEMNAKLLQKIEELTLYAIEQEKEIRTLKEENKSFKKLSDRLSAIEQKIK